MAGPSNPGAVQTPNQPFNAISSIQMPRPGGINFTPGQRMGLAGLSGGAVQRPNQMQNQGMTNQALGPSPSPNQGMAQPTGPNVFQQSANALTQAQNAAGQLAGFQPGQMQAAQLGPASRVGAVGQVGNVRSVGQVGPMGYAGQVGDINAPGRIGVNQLQNLNVGAYMNPYIEQVINRGQSDIERQRQMASNALGAEATAAGAFGGSRQAVQEGVLAGEAARAAGDLSAQQRQAGFNQALQAGQFDIGNIQNARTLASQQAMQAGALNQQAAEAAAARRQASMGANLQAREAAAAREQQARLVNQQAAEAAAGRLQGAYGTNAAAQNQFALQQAALQQQANQANFGGQFDAAGIRQGAAGLLGNLAQTGYNFGTGMTEAQGQQGAAMRNINQGLIDAARNQYSGFTGAPANSLQAMLASVGAADMDQQTQTTSQQRGLFDWLGLGASLIPRPF